MKAATPTRVLQLLCTLLHVVLGTSIGDDHQHLRHVPPHAAVRGEDFLIDVLQSNAWRGRGHRTVSSRNRFLFCFLFFQKTTKTVGFCCRSGAPVLVLPPL